MTQKDKHADAKPLPCCTPAFFAPFLYPFAQQSAPAGVAIRASREAICALCVFPIAIGICALCAGAAALAQALRLLHFPHAESTRNPPTVLHPCIFCGLCLLYFLRPLRCIPFCALCGYCISLMLKLHENLLPCCPPCIFCALSPRQRRVAIRVSGEAILRPLRCIPFCALCGYCISLMMNYSAKPPTPHYTFSI
jgi:hypothetical protein